MFQVNGDKRVARISSDLSEQGRKEARIVHHFKSIFSKIFIEKRVKQKKTFVCMYLRVTSESNSTSYKAQYRTLLVYSFLRLYPTRV